MRKSTLAAGAVIEDAGVAAAVNAAMRATYGLLDAAIAFVIDHSRGWPVLNEPAAPPRSGEQGPRGDEP